VALQEVADNMGQALHNEMFIFGCAALLGFGALGAICANGRNCAWLAAEAKLPNLLAGEPRCQL